MAATGTGKCGLQHHVGHRGASVASSNGQCDDDLEEDVEVCMYLAEQIIPTIAIRILRALSMSYRGRKPGHEYSAVPMDGKRVDELEERPAQHPPKTRHWRASSICKWGMIGLPLLGLLILYVRSPSTT